MTSKEKERKYKFTGETREILGRTVHRIVAVRSFGNVKKGDKGGWIEKESNLSHECNCWVYDDASVYGNASVYGFSRVFDDVDLYGNAGLDGTASVSSNGDYIVFKNWWSSGRYFTWTRSNNMWRVGCFYGTGEELIRKAYCDSEESGREYERIVQYVEGILKAEASK